MANQVSHCVQGNGPRWIFLHGWGMHQGIWTPLLPALSQALTVHTVDLPGFGNSAWQESFKDFNSAVIQLEQAILDQIGSQPIRILGWSMGGLFATALAARNKLNIEALCLVASSPKFIQADGWPGIQNKILAVFQKQLEFDYQKTIERFLAVQAMGSPHVKEDIKRIKALLEKGPAPQPGALIAGLDWLQNVNLKNTFEHLTCPTLRLYGRLDSLVPVAQADILQKPQDQTFIFNQSAHTPFLNEMTLFCELLLDFEAQLKFKF